MSQPHDPFALSFDAIEIDPARAPRRDAIERAMAHVAPRPVTADAPGFALIDDCGGRFVIDRDFGVISLADEVWLAREAGAVHAPRVRVVEASGATYEMEVALKLTGMVPRAANGEQIDFLASPDLPAAPARPDQVRPRGWESYAVFAAHGARAPLSGDERAPYGALAPSRPLPDIREAARLSIYADLPAPAPAGARWPL